MREKPIIYAVHNICLSQVRFAVGHPKWSSFVTKSKKLSREKFE
jgi:hypothetical protein